MFIASTPVHGVRKSRLLYKKISYFETHILVFHIVINIKGLLHKKSKYLVEEINSFLDLKIFPYIINRIRFTSKNSFYKNDLKSDHKRCNFWIPQPNNLIFLWRIPLQYAENKNVNLRSWDFSFNQFKVYQSVSYRSVYVRDLEALVYFSGPEIYFTKFW
jgi:hypothetical protein